MPSRPGQAARFPSEAFWSKLPSGMRDDGIRHALVADQRGQRARVDAGDADDAARLQPGVEIPGRGSWTGSVIGLAHDHAAHAGRAAMFTVSTSSSLVPTLPICGKVKVMICPA
jgi:hypothetical protein